MRKEAFPRLGTAHREENAVDADRYQGADRKEMDPEGVDLKLRPTPFLAGPGVAALRLGCTSEPISTGEAGCWPFA
ncbi:hypothetical protein MPNT_30066 [Candidatus Methylacidithermus pantelleriae]|uniref:Uncharacterized protein n=1 Tax=Candidatus Methylacidithermus pantelleriae TaxID=2744239 RepID=A0A8J2BPF2_9BACT|nr:hypothetical protein MPNT_30066 [Candidatus Methylacidithermus pantelleriae]